MSLSISNSDNNVLPAVSVFRDWLYILICFVILITFSELYFRGQGHKPHVSDSSWLWSHHRSDVYTKFEQKRIVIVGASHAQLGIVPEIMDEEIEGYVTKQLAINGSTPAYEIVKNLCEDPLFDGVIVWEAMPQSIIGHLYNENRTDLKHLNYFQSEFRKPGRWNQESNAYFAALIKDNLALVRISFMEQLLSQVKPKYLSMSFNRYISARYRETMSEDELKKWLHNRQIAREKKKRPAIPFNVEAYEDFVRAELPRLNKLIEQKGGKLILVHLPEAWTGTEKPYLKEKYWDTIHTLTGVMTIHFRDYPELAAFECPDGSHLDAVDALEFTRQLSKIIKQKLSADANR